MLPQKLCLAQGQFLNTFLSALLSKAFKDTLLELPEPLSFSQQPYDVDSGFKVTLQASWWSRDVKITEIPGSHESPRELTLKPMPPFLQHRQANMRKMKVKSPEKETATTTREEDQESSLRGVPSVGRYKETTGRTN